LEGSESEAQASSAELRTDTTIYVWHGTGAYTVRVVATLTNRGAAALYLAECSPGFAPPTYGVVRAAPDTGKMFIFAESAGRACLDPARAIPLNPGASRQDTLILSSTASPNASPPIGEHERVGLFRLIYRLYSRKQADGTIDAGSLLTSTDSQSNPFQITF
jgi:hypothetical protein